MSCQFLASYSVVFLVISWQAVDKDCCIMSSSSRNSAGKGGSDSQLCEILPANRSSLAHQKQMQGVSMKQSSFLLGNGSKLRLSGTTYRHKTSEIVDLTSNDSSNLNSDAELIVSCSSKRQRVPEIKPANTQYKAVPCDMTSGITKVKSEGTPLKSGYIEENRFQSSLNKKMKKTIASSSVEAVGNITAQETGSSQANQGTLSLSCQDEEAKGYNFLTQV